VKTDLRQQSFSVANGNTRQDQMFSASALDAIIPRAGWRTGLRHNASVDPSMISSGLKTSSLAEARR
jgi:hypothetical protein